MLPTTPPGLTPQGAILGTFQYMAPEQLEGREADARTDIFAFGAMLYEMLTGKKAFRRQEPGESDRRDSERRTSADQPAATRRAARLDYLVRTCLAKDPDARFQSVHDVRLQLKWIVERSNVGVVAPIVAQDASDTTFTAAMALAASRWRQ